MLTCAWCHQHYWMTVCIQEVTAWTHSSSCKRHTMETEKTFCSQPAHFELWTFYFHFLSLIDMNIIVSCTAWSKEVSVLVQFLFSPTTHFTSKHLTVKIQISYIIMSDSSSSVTTSVDRFWIQDILDESVFQWAAASCVMTNWIQKMARFRGLMGRSEASTHLSTCLVYILLSTCGEGWETTRWFSDNNSCCTDSGKVLNSRLTVCAAFVSESAADLHF